MNFASPYTFIRSEANKVPKVNWAQACQVLPPQTDTNVVSISFSNLKESEKKLSTGDPVFCKKCGAVFNKFSLLLSAVDYMKINEDKKKQPSEKVVKPAEKPVNEEMEEERKADEKELIVVEEIGEKIIMELELGDKVWVCEFCGDHNKMNIEKEEIPTESDLIYMVQSFNQAQSNPQNKEIDISIVFCIDNSGSMSSTTEIEGKVNLRHGLTEEEYEMLKQFIEPGAENQQYILGSKRNVSYISRKQCVLAAIEHQLSEMKKENPGRKIGVVSFNNDVTVIGDGKSVPETITGDRLNKYEEILKISESHSEKLLSHSILDSSEPILKALDKLEEKGRTALGPALLSSVGLLSKSKEGSMVILCTDGLANVGLGALDSEKAEDLERASAFYEGLGAVAKEKGIVISVLTLKGEGCKMEYLGKIADLTNGNVTRVNPSDVAKDFASILKDEVVATKVRMDIRLHKGLKFRNEDQNDLKDEDSLCQKNLGNATIETEVTFEYDVKNDEDLQKDKINLENLKEIPFQAQIHYTNLSGHKLMRVITNTRKLTKDKNLAENGADVKIIHTMAAQRSAAMVSLGKLQEAKKYNQKWSDYLEVNENLNSAPQQRATNQAYHDRHRNFRKYVQKKEKKSGGVFNKIADLFSSKKKEEEVEEEMVSEENEEAEKVKKSGLARNSSFENLSDLACSDDEGENMVHNFKKGK